MVNDKYVVKYLDPRTGKYEYATIKDVGDLQKLNTKVKTSIVDAINSISTDGIDGIDGLRNDLDTIGKTIKSLEDGTLELGDFQSIDDVVSREIEDAINSLKDENSGLLKLTQEEIDKIVSDAESEYRDSIAASVRELETSKSDLEDAREKMTSIGQMLENADINYSSLTQVVDDINLYITDVIEKTDFDMVNGIVSDYKTAVTQSKDGWGVDASKNMLSYLTGRVKNNETSLDVQHGLIQAKVGKDEFQYMTVDNLPAGKENMLHNTSDLRDWNFSSAFIFKSADDYRFTSIVQSDSAGENIIGTTDELEQGVTYAISAYVNVQNKNKKPNEEKYASTDGLYTATVIIDGDTIELNNVVEDNSALDGWKRVSGTFIAKRTAQQDIKFYVTAFNRNTQVGYLSAPKLEKGSSATSWIPHIEDNVSTILSQNAVMRVLSDRITSSVEEVRETKGAFETATSTFNQMADGFALNTNKLSEVLDKYGEVTGVQTQQASELKVLNESITSKVWKQDINTTLDTINIDTSNRIVNSAFNIYSYDEQTGELKLDYWDSNTGFAIKKHSQSLDNYLYAKRSNATSVNPISIKSSPFALRDGEKILFNFEYLAVGNPLDNDNVFTLEMFDNNDVRVGLQEFKLSELKKEFLTAYDVGDSYKYNGTYIVKNSSVVKGTITLKLPKNGELWLTKIMLQNAGIGTIGWTPSSIDNQIIQSKLSTEINQLADSIELVAKDERLDAISGLLVKKDGKITISPEAIVSRVTSQELGDSGLVTQSSIKQTEDSLRLDLVDKEGIIQTINASADGLLIDFDKVQIDGELIARMISAQSIDATQGFRLTDNNGNTLLGVVNDDGTPTLSIARDFNVKFKDFSNKLDVTVVNVVDEYYHSTDQYKPMGGQWTSAPNDFRGDTFVWKRTKVVLQSGKEYYLPDKNGINITSGWNYAKGEVTNAIEAAQEEADKAVQSAKDADARAGTAIEKAGTNANLLITHQTTLNEIKNTTLPAITSSAQDALASAKDAMDEAKLVDGKVETFKTEVGNTISDVNNKAQKAVDDAKLVDGKIETFKTDIGNTISTVRNSAQEAMDEAKKADGKIADYVTRNGLVSGTTVDSKINTATGEWSENLSRVEGKIPTSVGGRNYLLNSGNSTALNINSNNGAVAPLTKGVENGIDWITQENADGFVITTYIQQHWRMGGAFGNTYSKDLEGYTGDITYSVGVMSPEPITIGLGIGNYRDGRKTTLVPNQWTRISITMKFEDEIRPMSFTALFDDNREIPLGTKLYWKNYKIEKGNIATDYSPAPEDNYTQQDFKIFEASYNSSVEGIDAKLGTVSNKVDDNGNAFTTFKENEYSRTAERVSDTFTKSETTTMLGTKADASQLSNYLAKSIYERDAEQSRERFETIESDLDNISVGGRNLISVNDIDVDNARLTNVLGTKDFIISGASGYAITSKIPVKPGEYLTITNYEQLSGFMSLSLFDENDVHVNRPLITEINDNPKSYTYKIPDGITYVRASYRKQDVGFIKLERGNKATDWSPAVEDMANLSYVSSEVTKSAEAIKTSLNSYAKSTDLNGLATETYATNQAVSEAGKVKNELTKYAKTTDLTGLASETYATNVAVSEAGKVSNELTKYAKTTALTGLASETYAQTQATTEAGKVEQKLTAYAKTTDLTGLATETYATNKAVTEAGKVSSELTKYELKTGVDSKISTASSALRTETAEKLKTVYTKTETETLLGKKADSSALNNYVQQATYENGIDGVTQSITTIRGDLDKLSVGGRNLALNTSTDLVSQPKNTGASSDNFNIIDIALSKPIKTGQEYTIQFNSEPIGNTYTKLNILERINGSNVQTRTVDVGIDVGAYTFKATKDIDRLFIYTGLISGTRGQGLRIFGKTLKVEIGTVATDWTPAPEEMLGQADFTVFKNDYETNDKTIKERLTAIDSSAEGSVVTRLNKTESTASGNSKLIATINNNYVTQQNIDTSILSDKKIKDTRSTNQLPSWYFSNYPAQEVREFKQVSTMGIGSGSYGILTTNVPWTGSSGGTVKQKFETNTETHVRQSNTGATAWGSWSKQIDTSDTTYQKVTQTSSLYERVLGSTEANVKNNISSIVQTSEIIQQTVTSAMNVENRNLLITKNATQDTWLTGSETYPKAGSQPNSGSSTSPDLIEVKNGDKFTLSKNETTMHFRVSFLNSSKAYIGRYVQNAKSETITPPNGTAYLWVSYPTNADAKVEKGSIATAYSPAPEDTATQSQITQLSDNIDLKVSSSALISQINVQAGSVLIQSGTNKLNITPTTTYIQNGTIKSAMIESLSADKIKTGSLDADLITAGIASKTGNRVTITNTGMKVSDSTFETEFINGGPAFFTKSSTGRSLIGEIGDLTSAFNSAKALGIKATYGTPIVLGVQMSKTDTTYKGKLAVHEGGVAVYDTLNVEGDLLFTQNGKQALKNIINVDKIFFQGTSYITSTAIIDTSNKSIPDTSGWLNLQAQWGTNFWYQNQKKARQYGDKFQFWCNIEPQSGFSVSGSSDARLKHNIVDVKESSLEKLEKIQFKNFTWNSNNKDDFGFIAQEVINIIPEIIEESEDGYYRYNSTRFNMIVAHATKELNDKVKFLENKIERLERIIDGN